MDHLPTVEDERPVGYPAARVDERDQPPSLRRPIVPEQKGLERGSGLRVLVRKIGKSSLAGAVLIAVGWVPIRELFAQASTEAIVNARLVTIRAPIEGEVSASADDLGADRPIYFGKPILKIENRRAERSRLDDLSRLVNQLHDEQIAARERLQGMVTAHSGLLDQTRMFQLARVKQLNARVAEIESEVASAHALSNEASSGLARATELYRTRSGSQQALDRAQREATVAQYSEAAATARLTVIRIELEAAQGGAFIEDNYNDRPRSFERADEIALRIADLSATLHEREVRIRTLTSEFERESQRAADRSIAQVVAPTSGRIWEVLTSPGEQVRQGQDLLRLLDCTGAVVTASVSEKVYNRLQLGDTAQFRFRDGHEFLNGTVIGLTGMSSVPANFAIVPSALSKEPYRVIVSIPEITSLTTCMVGRSGKVVFNLSQPGVAGSKQALHLR